MQSEADRLFRPRRQHGFGYGVLTKERPGEVVRSGGHLARKLLNLGQLDVKPAQDVDIGRLGWPDVEGRTHRYEPA